MAPLTGYKTYILAACGVVLAGLHALGLISPAAYDTLFPLIGAGAVATLRQAIQTNAVKTQDVVLATAPTVAAAVRGAVVAASPPPPAG